MLRAIRRSRLASELVATILVALVALTVSSSLHDRNDDPLCNELVAGGSLDGVRIAAADVAAPHRQHCAVCHVLQSLRAEVTAARFVSPQLDLRLIAAAAVAVVPALHGSAQPARAPPLA